MFSKYNITPNNFQLGIGVELDLNWNWIGTGLELLRWKDEWKMRPPLFLFEKTSFIFVADKRCHL